MGRVSSWRRTGVAVAAAVALTGGGVAAPSGAVAQEPGGPPAVVGSGGGLLHAVTPQRVLDTREDGGGAVRAGSDRELVVLGRGGVPGSGVSAVVLNVTVTQGSQRGDLQVYPVGQRPAQRTSNLNWAAGQTVPVLVKTGVGNDGRVGLSVNAGSVHVVADVFGWYDDGSGGVDGDQGQGAGLVSLSPRRVLDTRTEGGAVQAGSPRVVRLAGRAGVAGDATAVVLNATVLGAPGNADLQVFPVGDRPQQRTSNLNVRRGETRANAVVAPVGQDGSVGLDVSQGSAHVVLDVLGFYGPGGQGRFVAVAPSRVLDTRQAREPVSAGTDRTFTVAGRGAVPVNADAAVLSVTATGAGAPLDLQVYPTGDRPQQRTSTLNLRPAMAVPNLAVARLGEQGRIGLSVSQASTHVVLDVTGYYTSATWSECRNPQEGWSAEYPAAWRTNAGTVLDTCSLFDPQPLLLDPAPGEIPLAIAVQLRREQVAVEDARQGPSFRLVDERETTVDGRTAFRQEREQTDGGIIPEGTRYVTWLVDLGGSQTLVASSYDVGQPAFSTKVEVLDAMMGRLQLDAPDDGDGVQPGSWRELPDAPIGNRLNASLTWAGDRLVVWGGGDGGPVRNDGAAWIPDEQRWQTVPPAPIDARWAHEALWTGRELVVWGGNEGPDHLAACYTDGARYDPRTRTWRQMADAPGDGRCGAVVAWTGDRMLVFGGVVGGGPPADLDAFHDDGLAYDPDTDSWSAIPAAPLSPRSSSVGGWSGSELVVWGGNGPVDEWHDDGAAYDPADGSWRTIADAPLPARAAPAGAFTDRGLVVLGGNDLVDRETYRSDAAAYDPASDSWRELSDLPSPQVSPELAWTGTGVLYVVGGDPRPDGQQGGAFLAYVTAEDSWVSRSEPPGGARTNHAVAWSGSRLYVWGGQSHRSDDDPPGAVWRPPS